MRKTTHIPEPAVMATQTQGEKGREDVQIHKDHRKRIKERYMQTGFEGFSNHEVLELLLFYVISRKDVNPLAHQLINRFGSVSGVMDAPYDELVGMEGLGDAAATYLKMFPKICRLYLVDKQKTEKSYTNITAVRQYLQPKFVGETREKLYLLLFDNGMHLLACECIAEGNQNTVHLPTRYMASLALKYQATGAILAHNHPNGMPYPSESDLSLTYELGKFLEQLDVILVEHLIFSDMGCVPALVQDQGMFRLKENDAFGKDFFQAFYQSLDYGDPTDYDTPPVLLENDMLYQFDEAERELQSKRN